MQEPLDALGGEIVTSVICDRHPAFAHGLARLLQEETPNVMVTGVTVSLGEAEHLIRKTRPDVALIGLAMDSARDLDTARGMCRASSNTKVILALERIGVPVALGSLSEAGVCGFVLKEREASEIARVMNLVAQGHFVMPANILGRHIGGRHDQPSLNSLELEMLKGVASGETNRQLARRLHLSQRTICRRLEEIYRKLGLADRLGAAVYAAMHGLIPGAEGGESLSRDGAAAPVGRTLERVSS